MYLKQNDLYDFNWLYTQFEITEDGLSFSLQDLRQSRNR